MKAGPNFTKRATETEMKAMTRTKAIGATIEHVPCLNCGETEALRDDDGSIACPKCNHSKFERVLCNMPDPRPMAIEEDVAGDIRTIADGSYWAVLDLRNRI